MLRRFLIILLALAIPLGVRAQEVPEGWSFGGSFYFEHDNSHYKYFDNWYTRPTLGVKVLPWLKADVAYDFMKTSSDLRHKLLLDLTGTLKSGNFKVALRERYMHTWIQGGGQGNELRSRLKVQYSIPDSRFTPYLALEVISWKDWMKTRHYVGCHYDFTSWMQLEVYYLYYTHNGRPAQHILGLGLNFNI